MTTQELAYEVISRLKKEYPDAVSGIWEFYQQSNFGNPPQVLVNTLTIWYIKRDL